MAGNITQNSTTVGPRLVVLYPKEFPILVIVIVSEIVVGSLANIFVISTFYVKRNLRRRPPDLLVLNLSIADLLCFVIILPWILYILIQRKFGGDTSIYIFASLYNFNQNCCANAVIAVTVDRFIAIVYNLRYRVVMTKKKTYILIALSWFWAMITGFGTLISYNFVEKYDYQIFGKTVSSQYILQFVLVFLMYVVIFKVAWTQAKNINAQGLFRGASFGVLVKTIWKSFSIVCLFYVSYLPILIYVFFILSTQIQQRDQTNTMLLRLYIISFFNSCINPFIYGLKRMRNNERI